MTQRSSKFVQCPVWTRRTPHSTWGAGEQPHGCVPCCLLCLTQFSWCEGTMLGTPLETTLSVANRTQQGNVHVRVLPAQPVLLHVETKHVEKAAGAHSSSAWSCNLTRRLGIMAVAAAEQALSCHFSQHSDWLLFVYAHQKNGCRMLTGTHRGPFWCAPTKLFLSLGWVADGWVLLLWVFFPLQKRCWLFLLAGVPGAFRSLSPDRKGMVWNCIDALDFLHCFLLNSWAKSDGGRYCITGPVFSMQFLRFTACLCMLESK